MLFAEACLGAGQLEEDENAIHGNDDIRCASEALSTLGGHGSLRSQFREQRGVIRETLLGAKRAATPNRAMVQNRRTASNEIILSAVENPLGIPRMVIDDNVGRQRARVGQGACGIGHLVQAEFEIDHVSAGTDIFERSGYKLERILPTFRNDFFLEQFKSVSVTINRDNPLGVNRGIEELLYSTSADIKDHFVREVVEAPEISDEQGVVGGHVKSLSDPF